MNRLFKQLAFNESPKMKQLNTMLSLLVRKKNNVQWNNRKDDILSLVNTTNLDSTLDFVQDILITHLEQKEKENHLTFLFEKTRPTLQDVQLAQKLVENLKPQSVSYYFQNINNPRYLRSAMITLKEIYDHTQNNETSKKTEGFNENSAHNLIRAHRISQGIFSKL